MSENDESGNDRLEEAAEEGPLPGVEAEDTAEEEGRDDSAVPGADREPADNPGSGVIMGGVNQH